VTCELTLPLLERRQSGSLDLALVKREPGSGITGSGAWREPLVWWKRADICPWRFHRIHECIGNAELMLLKLQENHGMSPTLAPRWPVSRQLCAPGWGDCPSRGTRASRT